MAKKAIPLSELPVVHKESDFTFSKDFFQSGAVMLLDKPLEWSSFDVVRYVRNRIGIKKVGHAGTLDPLATGLLILCSGKATKSISQIQDQFKEYVATIKFGESTPSYDAALDADQTKPWEHIELEHVKEAIENEFSGTIEQVPPIYSAIQVRGERLYKKARRGETLELPPRQITIHSTEILSFDMPYCTVKIRCGKGTYIRSFAHDLGITLDSRAHLTELRRTKTGEFSVDDAVIPSKFDELRKE